MALFIYKSLIKQHHHTVMWNENPHLEATCVPTLCWTHVHSSLMLSDTPSQLPWDSCQFPGCERFNRGGRFIYPHTPSNGVLVLTYFNTHPLGARKASLVWSVIAVSSSPPPLRSLCASSTITIIRRITLQIPFNSSFGMHVKPTEEYTLLSHLPLLSPPVSEQDITRQGTGEMIRTPLNRQNLSLICLLPLSRVKNRPKLSSVNHNFFSFLGLPPSLLLPRFNVS